MGMMSLYVVDYTRTYSVRHDMCGLTAMMNSRCSASSASRVKGEGGFLAPGYQEIEEE
jgi:hypothetical protein